MIEEFDEEGVEVENDQAWECWGLGDLEPSIDDDSSKVWFTILLGFFVCLYLKYSIAIGLEEEERALSWLMNEWMTEGD